MAAESPRVLVVDDEPQIVRGVKVVLRHGGFEVDTAETCASALDRIALRSPDVVVLDLMLPDGSGIDVCREIRSWSRLPIIVLSAIGDEREKVRALDAGADDYMTKPFGPDELLARLRALLRRTGPETGEPAVTVGRLTIDLAARRVLRDDEEVHLTPMEFALLRELALHCGKLVTHRQLLQAVWGPRYTTETHYLRVYVGRIRAKLELDPARPRFITTDAGVGYRLRDPDMRV